MGDVDVVVVGSGPNGLAAAVTAARAGLSVRVLEAAATVGGGTRTAELTVPGFRHDVGSAVHPAAISSPFFREFGLAERLTWVVPEASYAHPFDGGLSGVAWRDLDRTVESLGRDGPAWRRLLGPLVHRIEGVIDFTGSHLLRWPNDPVAAMQFALRSAEQGSFMWGSRFRDDIAPALLTGAMAHAPARMPSPAAAGAGLLLAAHAHAGGWGFPAGGSQAIADALAADLLAHGGEIVTGAPVTSLSELPPARAVLLDTSPRLLLTATLPSRYQRAIERYRYGVGVAKVDFALSEPVPWTHPDVSAAPTVHLGGTREEITAAERQVFAGTVPSRPYVLVTQPSILDLARVTGDGHTLWAYMHVPAGSTLDPTEHVTRQVERYAPGFRDTIIASSSMSAEAQADHNPANIGGDIYGGELSLRQLLVRPVLSTRPWRTPVDGVYLCSAATPPGPAVHGMNGWHAATLALAERFGIRLDRLPDASATGATD